MGGKNVISELEVYKKKFAVCISCSHKTSRTHVLFENFTTIGSMAGWYLLKCLLPLVEFRNI